MIRIYIWYKAPNNYYRPIWDTKYIQISNKKKYYSLIYMENKLGGGVTYQAPIGRIEGQRK